MSYGRTKARTRTKSEKADLKAKACVKLLEILKPGDTVYPVMIHRSSSGMMRHFQVLVPENGIEDTGIYGDDPVKVGAMGSLSPVWDAEGGIVRTPYTSVDGKVTAVTAAGDLVTLSYPKASGLEPKQFRRSEVRLWTRRKVLKIRDVSGWVADAFEENLADDGGVKMGGCGMDMAFALVYNLGSTLWPKGTRKPHGKRNGEPDTAGGYALKKVTL